jgi:hypothetical protein
MKPIWLALSGLLAMAAPAAAQDEPAEGAEGEEAAPAKEETDPNLFEGENPGEEETPDDPYMGGLAEPEPVVVKKVTAPSSGYPIEVARRPIIVPRSMVEASFGYRVNASPFRGDGLIGGRFGVTDRIQAGLRYGFGSATSDGYEAGKTLALDGEYLLRPWVAAQLSIPILVNPISVGVTLGAPMKFVFFDKLAFQFFRNLVSFRTNRFVPNVENAAVTEALIEQDEIGGVIPDGEIRIEASAIYQHKANVAAELRGALIAPDFELGSDAPVLFDLGLYYSHDKRLDLGGRIGFEDLGDAGDSFGLSLFAAWRVGG